jgi:flagellar protein FlaG
MPGADLLPSACHSVPNLLGCLSETLPLSNFNEQPEIRIKNSEDYREGYSNSVQVRMSVWDFFLAFGKALPGNGPGIDLLNFQGVYLSPQQAKALSLMLQQNVANYEQTFGEIKIDPQFTQNGPIH